MELNEAIQGFVSQAQTAGWVDSIDKVYIQNRLLAIFKEDGLNELDIEFEESLFVYLDSLVDHAIERKLIEAIGYQKEQLIAQVMDLITPLPSQLNTKFWTLYQEHPTKATDYFFALSKANDYIKTRDIARNIAFDYEGKYGNLNITINLSKPEKDPKEIAMAKLVPASHYPKCPLCMENEGYKGRPDAAARQNHRLIRLELNQQVYGMQYSPYQYYNEHSIFLNQDHVPMVIDRKCFENLLEIVTQFPHYFVSSNADLPIVGGSILSHDHYQGGCNQFPMDVAKIYGHYQFKGFEHVEVELVEWPLSVIRLRSQDKLAILDLADKILSTWRSYSDPECEILAFTGEVPHNTLNPVARRKGQAYELDLVLRNNRQTDQYPDGLFHPHQDVQHIKKENIGIIEVLGLAILPPRIKGEMEAVKAYLLNQVSLSEVASSHQEWAASIKANRQVTSDNVDSVIQAEIGNVFERVLEDAGVYKNNSAGRTGLMRFLDRVNEVNNEYAS